MATTLPAQQLEAQLKQGISPLYYLASDELLLSHEALDLIRREAKQQGFSEKHSFILSATSSWAAIWNQLQDVSLFGDKKLVELHLPSGKPGLAGSKQLQELSKQLSDGRLRDICVVIVLPKLDTSSDKSAWAKALKQIAIQVSIPTIGAAQLPKWIVERLSRNHQSITPETLAWLTEHVEGNLFAAYQEIQKLALIYPAGELSEQDVRQAVLDVSRYNVFDLLDAVYQNTPQKVAKILHGLQAEGESLMPVLGLVSKLIRDLYVLAQARLQSLPLSPIFQQLRIFPSRQQVYLSLLDRLSFKTIMGLTQHALDVELIFKGQTISNRLNQPWQELHKLILRLF